MVEVVGTVHGYGPFVRGTANDSFAPAAIVHQSQGLMILLFAAEVSERRRQEEHARALAVSDPLPGWRTIACCSTAWIRKSSAISATGTLSRSSARSGWIKEDQR